MKRNQIYLMAILGTFLVSSIAFPFFFISPSTTGNLQNFPGIEFPEQNEFNYTVGAQTKALAIYPQNPKNFPGVDQRRLFGGVWIEYSCDNCTEELESLRKIVEKYYPRVYISPGHGNYSLRLASAINTETFENFSIEEVEKFICANLYNPPDICILIS